MARESGKAFDLVFVVDATASMSAFVNALRLAIPHTLRMARMLPDTVGRVAGLAYRDYDQAPSSRVEFSGWTCEDACTKRITLFIRNARADGGGNDSGEAAKLAASRLLEAVDGVRRTVVMWFTDSPPHHPDETGSLCANGRAERKDLRYRAWDWVGISDALRAKRITVFPVLPETRAHPVEPWVEHYMALMAERTGGVASRVQNEPKHIARRMLGLLIRAAGWPHEFGEVQRILLPPHDAAEVSTEAQAIAAGLLPKIGWKPEEHRLLTERLASGSVDGADSVQRASDVFRDDARLRDTVYATFLEMALSTQQACHLTSNVLFRAFWRAICVRRFDLRRAPIVDALSRTVAFMVPDDQKAMRAFIERSYGQTAEIEAMCDEARERVPGGPELVLDEAAGPADRLSEVEFTDALRTCLPSALAKITTRLNGLRISSDHLAEGRSIPLAVGPRFLFNVLPHLMTPGLLLPSGGTSAVLAALAILAGAASVVGEAAKMLCNAKGSWVHPNLKVENTPDFIRLMRRAAALVPDSFEKADLDRLDLIIRVAGVQANVLTTLVARVGHSSNKTVRPDRKHPCASCGHLRSTSLLINGLGKLSFAEATAKATASASAALSPCRGMCRLCRVNNDPPPDLLGPGRSCFCECGTCGAHFVVAEPDKLKVPPMCLGCRGGGGVIAQLFPPSRCLRCKNHYATAITEDRYVCPTCDAAGAAVTEDVSVTVAELLTVNGLALAGIAHRDGVSAFLRSTSAIMPAMSAVAVPSLLLLRVRGKAVLNVAELVASLEGWITSGKAQLGECAMCFEDLPKAQLESTCGACSSVSCAACLGAWYGVTRRGGPVLETRLLCPCCKKRPTTKTLARHNPRAAELTDADVDALQANPGFHHGWCVTCGRIKPAVARECHADAPALVDFQCDACVEVTARATAQATARATRAAPCCGVTVFKTGGCNHMACACGKHWCWVCGFVGVDSGAVYGHMTSAHGGFFGVNMGQDSDSDEDDGWSSDESDE